MMQDMQINSDPDMVDGEDKAPSEWQAQAGPQHVGMRLDRLLADFWRAFSRTRIKSLIEGGHVLVNAEPLLDASYRVEVGDLFSMVAPEPVEAAPEPENIPLDIIYEDDDLLVINKHADMVVHPAAGHGSGTLVNALLYHCGDSLSGVGGVKRPGIVHRLDRGTSGLMLVAKHDQAHIALQAQLSDRSLGRIYHAVTLKCPVPPAGVIDKPVGRHPTNRLKMTVGGKDGREAITRYRTLEAFGDMGALVECRLATGRTHQIRVHLSSIGYPLLGDPLYGAAATAVLAAIKRDGSRTADQAAVISGFGRQALHACEIHFIHPRTGAEMSFAAPYPEDMDYLIKSLK